MAKTRKFSADRRRFLKGAAVAGAATLAAPTGMAQSQPAQAQRAAAVPLPPPGAEAGTPPEVDVLTADRCGSDFMVDVIKSLDIEYFCSNPGSSFRALHESVINYGSNTKPEFITCCHEESSVGMAHGYAKIEGKPLGVLAHGTVGLQHASMAIFNAYCDRVPMYIIAGNTIDATQRRPGVEWNHSVQDAAAMVRDYIKWDDLPISLNHFAESAVRAYKIAMTLPTAPVLLVADSDLQEEGIKDRSKLNIPKLTLTRPPTGDSGAVAEVAKLLVAAENPVILSGRSARTPEGMKLLVELAETIQAPVQGETRNFPSRHPLSGAGNVRNADVILGLQVDDFWGTVHNYRDQQERSYTSITKAGAKLISISSWDLYTKSNYQDFQRYPEIDIAIAADAEATLPSLIEACKKLITGHRRRTLDDRGKKLAAASEQGLQRARTEATYAWDASPVSTGRVWAEMWDAVRTKD